ncbi:MAG: hypothetical protein EOM91_07040 [Sphingobacteriia bacterium]|nr:hypothetical protein [Sphingobacteriia bacterium]NCC38897.1 hypothetical protein [Gammaproteobacteria bacterium]
MTNQRLYLSVALAAAFIAIFVITTLILSTLMPGRESAPPPATPTVPRESAAPEARTDAPRQTRERLAGPWLGPPAATPPDRQDGPAIRSDPHADWRRDWPHGSGHAEGVSPFTAYRFRPLDERERQRVDQTADGSSRAGPTWPLATGDRAGALGATPWPGAEDETTRSHFRPLDPPRATPSPRRPATDRTGRPWPAPPLQDPIWWVAPSEPWGP